MSAQRMNLQRRFKLQLAILMYWVVLPALLLFVAHKADLLLSFSSLPAEVAVPIGGLLLFGSIAISSWCVATLYLRGGGFPLAFMPPVRLVREGPYALSRHPLYLAFTLYLLGLSLIVRSLAGVMIVVPAFALLWILYARLHEEGVLVRRYGEEYRQYKKDVPFFFHSQRDIPGPSIVYAIVYLVGKVIVHIMYSVTVKGEENVPRSGPCILLSNHASYLDPVFLVAACNRYVRFFTTGEMMRTRLGRWFFNGMGSIPTSRYKVDSASVRAFLAALKTGDIVGIFPEGERTWDGNPLPINTTVVRLLKRANVPIVAARIEGSYAAYPRWSSYPLPGRIAVHFFAASLSDQIENVFPRIRTNKAGTTVFPRSTRGLERLVWACPACGTIGGIAPYGSRIVCDHCHAEWLLDRSLNVRATDGTSVPLPQFVSFLSEKDFFREMDSLSSIGSVDLLVGGEELSRVASGEVVYRDGALHVGERSFPLSEARIIRLEGKDRLDIGFAQDSRLRMVFHRDSPLKWEHFLHAKLKRET
ncbi:MAG TPA: hypothetical protein ENL23_00655 [Candidatus Acetothermia bacterium]|nr:hypothetical protein [Candidatus Acetothermia bacterium]